MNISEIKELRPTNLGGGFDNIKDKKIRAIAISVADQLDIEARQRVVFAYTNKQYQKMVMDKASGDYSRKGAWMKHSLEIPQDVFDFLSKYFGTTQWIQNKKLWKHELVKPWVVRK